MGVARIFQRGGHTDSYIGYSPNCHLNIVGCLLTKRLTKGGVTGTPEPPPLATPLRLTPKGSTGKKEQRTSFSGAPAAQRAASGAPYPYGKLKETHVLIFS